METNYLRTFVWVVEAGSMSEAARRLDVTPAAVAQQLRVLEQELGAPLLARSGRTVRPTEAGHRLVERARTVLRDVADLKTVVADHSQGIELVVGAINTMLHGLMPRVLEALIREHPTARLDVRTGLSADLYDRVLQGELDAAICLLPAFALPKTVHWEPLREEPLVVLAPAAWAHRDAHELLRNEPLIRYDRRLGGGKAAERYLRRMGIVPTERFELSSIASIALVVARGLGVSIAPDAGIDWWPSQPVVRVPLPDTSESRYLGMMWQRASLHGRAIETLVDCMRRTMRKAGG